MLIDVYNITLRITGEGNIADDCYRYLGKDIGEIA